MHRKLYYREFYYNIKMFMNNVIILFLAVRICEDSDNRGCTVYVECYFYFPPVCLNYFQGLSQTSVLHLKYIPHS